MTEITYTPEQNAVISADTYASMLIVAGAGSGKTFTMTQRIIALIKQGVSPEKILGLTFTKAAATELLTRVSSQVYAHRAHTRQDEETDADSAFLKPEVYTYDAFF
ncbi:MAG: UvrD-helicase domain-containing protein, partial [Alloscardovia omnicolens]|nr:UvrD-helicase domain-containing protein [Alloscardovia omnicolens]